MYRYYQIVEVLVFLGLFLLTERATCSPGGRREGEGEEGEGGGGSGGGGVIVSSYSKLF